MVPTCKYKQLFWTVLNCHSSTNFITKQHFFSDLTKSHTDLSNQIVSYQNQIETIKRDLEAAQADLSAKNLSCETASANLEAKDRVIADLSDQCNGHELSIEKLQSTVKSVSQVIHSDLFWIILFGKYKECTVKCVGLCQSCQTKAEFAIFSVSKARRLLYFFFLWRQK